MNRERLEKIADWLELFWLNLKVGGRSFLSYFQEGFQNYHHWQFCRLDHALLLSYLFANPFHISKRFLLENGEQDLYTYGETPLTTMKQIAKRCRIQKTDRVFELGSGRGRCCFWLNQMIGCSVVGIEQVPEFIKRAESIRERFNLNQMEFRAENFLQSDFSGGTVFYFYGSSYSDEFIAALAKKLAKMPEGTKVITVSYPLSDYSEGFELMGRFQGQFTWGSADIYYQIVRGDS